MFNIFKFIILICFLTGCSKSYKAEVKKENVGNAELAYYVRGSGEPLVMIMGFRGTMAAWDPALLEMLEKKYRLILFDNRGVGLSTNEDSEVLTITQMAEDTAKLIKALGYQKANVLGWSMGSRIAMELAVKHPEILSTLILCSPNPGGKHQAFRKTNAYKNLTSNDLSMKEGLSLIFPDNKRGQEASESFVVRLKKAIFEGQVPDDLKVSPDTVHRQVMALDFWDENNDMFDSLRDIKIPTLVAGGLDDVLDMPENVKIVSGQIPYSWVAYFPDAGHGFLSQDHQHFADLVNLFIETNKPE